MLSHSLDYINIVRTQHERAVSPAYLYVELLFHLAQFPPMVRTLSLDMRGEVENFLA